ncbi:general transcription factor 3C polypeptide 2-like isoform X2 [Harmonia axyridis]|nr:general transcription factor 3C polypeptide 2-like isoform X2 [Harmonia axyridis]
MGRKRKSVNYFNLANPDFDEVIEDKRNKVDVKSNVKKNSPLKSVKSPSKKSTLPHAEIKKRSVNTVSKNIENQVTENQEDSTKAADISTLATRSENIEIKTEEDSEGGTPLNNVSSEDLDESQEFEIHVKKEKVYRRTGNTAQMTNTLYSQAQLSKNISDPDVASNGSPASKKKKLGKTKKKIKTDDDDAQNDFADQKTVTCAVCNKELDKSDWFYHKQRYHNNLAWRIGDPPLDLNNIDLVKQILNALYAQRKPFYCDTCDKSVKSVNGFLSHKSVCGKPSEDVKVACTYCSKRLLPVSMPSHIRLVHEDKDRVEIVAKKRTSALASGGKRQAAEKALKVIKNFNLETFGINTTFDKYFKELAFISSEEAEIMLINQIDESNRVQCKYPECNFECFTSKDIKNHLKFCVKKPDIGYVCRYCLLVQLNIADMIYHIETIHKVLVDVEEEYIEERVSNNVQKRDSKQNASNKRKANSGEKDKPKKYPQFLLPADKDKDFIFNKAHVWTKEFCENNFSLALPEEIFPCLKSNWDYMDLDASVEYLPGMPYSCDVGFETVVGFQDVLHKDHTFRKFEIFESYLENNGNSTIFCGGPVTALSWMPTPYNTDGIHQIVAVAVQHHPDDRFATNANYNEKCLIQFWDVGPLKNTDTSLFRPKQAFCMQFDHGPIWDLQWCPSNCYDLSDPPDDSDKLRRLGVLAVAGSDSWVYIYSIPNLKECGQFYNIRPVLILIRDVVEKGKSGSRAYYATRMSWTKAAGHKYLAVGYSNGQVAMYNLWSFSKVLRHKTNCSTDVLTPYTVLEAHCHSITAIALHHSHGGCRWLLTGSYDRTVRTWNVETKQCVRVLKGNIVNDAVWMTNWMCYIVGYDEASTIGNVCSVIYQCKEGLSDPLNLFHCSSSITSLSTSDWLNGIIQANAMGEVFATFPKQLMMNLNWKNLKNKKLLFGYTTLVEKNKTIEERLKLNSEKEKALRNQLKVKTKIKTEELPSNREVTHLDYNPHYFEYEPLVYHEMDEKYGLIFCDHKMQKWSDFPPKLQEHMSHSSEKYAPSRPNMYPIQSITKIQFNMNRQASTYYMSGYQAGFLRLTHLKFLDGDPSIVKDTLNKKK